MTLALWLTLRPLLTSPVPWLMGLLGLILGSFLNVCIYRLPTGTFWHSQRSRCPHCQALIPAWLNIPLLSFAWLRGRSRCCGQKLSPQYPVVEALTGLLFLCIYCRLPFLSWQGGAWHLEVNDAWRFLHASTFACLLTVCSFIDINLRIIPDKITLPMIAATPLVIYLHPELSWRSGLLGVLVGGLVVYGIAWIYILVRKREGIGMGDVKLLAAIGGWLGYEGVLPSLFYGSILGSLYGLTAIVVTRRFSLQQELPFGPFLAIGAMIHLLARMHWHELLVF